MLNIAHSNEMCSTDQGTLHELKDVMHFIQGPEKITTRLRPYLFGSQIVFWAFAQMI